MPIMSCYFRHLKDVFQELGIIVTKDNKRAAGTLTQIKYIPGNFTRTYLPEYFLDFIIKIA